MAVKRSNRRHFGAIEIVAALWGLAEATLFFIVPDVWLTAAAVHSPRRALIGCIAALIGALVGGTVMYAWGGGDADTAIATVERVPAVSTEMVTAVDNSVQNHGAAAMFAGLTNGTPYKLYAVTCGAQHTGLVTFLAVSAVARLLRFAALTAVAIATSRLTSRWLSQRTQHVVLLVGWALFYAWFLLHMPG